MIAAGTRKKLNLRFLRVAIKSHEQQQNTYTYFKTAGSHQLAVRVNFKGLSVRKGTAGKPALL